MSTNKTKLTETQVISLNKTLIDIDKRIEALNKELYECEHNAVNCINSVVEELIKLYSIKVSSNGLQLDSTLLPV